MGKWKISRNFSLPESNDVLRRHDVLTKEDTLPNSRKCGLSLHLQETWLAEEKIADAWMIHEIASVGSRKNSTPRSSWRISPEIHVEELLLAHEIRAPVNQVPDLQRRPVLAY